MTDEPIIPPEEPTPEVLFNEDGTLHDDNDAAYHVLRMYWESLSMMMYSDLNGRPLLTMTITENDQLPWISADLEEMVSDMVSRDMAFDYFDLMKMAQSFRHMADILTTKARSQANECSWQTVHFRGERNLSRGKEFRFVFAEDKVMALDGPTYEEPTDEMLAEIGMRRATEEEERERQGDDNGGSADKAG